MKTATTTRKQYRKVAARPCQVSGAILRPPSFFPNQSGGLSCSTSSPVAVRLPGDRCMDPSAHGTARPISAGGPRPVDVRPTCPRQGSDTSGTLSTAPLGPTPVRAAWAIRPAAGAMRTRPTDGGASQPQIPRGNRRQTQSERGANRTEGRPDTVRRSDARNQSPDRWKTDCVTSRKIVATMRIGLGGV